MTESELYRKSDNKDIDAYYDNFEPETVREWQEKAKQSVFCENSSSPYALNLQNNWVREQFETFKQTYGISIPSDAQRLMFEKRTTDHYFEHGAEGRVSFPAVTSRRRTISDEELAKIV